MTKITVETTGEFMMQDPTTGEEVEAYGTSQVTRSAWIEQQIENGKLKSAGHKAASKDEAEEDQPVRAAVAEKGEPRGLKQKQAGINSVKL